MDGRLCGVGEEACTLCAVASILHNRHADTGEAAQVSRASPMIRRGRTRERVYAAGNGWPADYSTGVSEFPKAQLSAAAGEYTFGSLRLAVDALQRGAVDAVVYGPLNKH
jgi:4-hydroxy-L-threonine phosphate dehydrogenase PdxA